MVELITENRVRLLEALEEIEPRMIMSFSPLQVKRIEARQLRVIVNAQQLRNTPTNFPGEWWVRTNNKVHAKIALGDKGFIVGSWNFSDHSTQTLHECVVVFQNEEACVVRRGLVEYFDRIWERSSELKSSK